MSDKALTLYTSPLSPPQAQKLKTILEEEEWKFTPKPYTLFYAQKNKLTLAVYEKGPKVVVQGKGTQEFVEFTLEPQILGEAKIGYEEVHAPERFEPHFGIDESGKGDFFGPLVIAGVYTDRNIAHRFMELGVQDSKNIKSDKKIRDLACAIRETRGAFQSVVPIGPLKYNQLYHGSFHGNLNRMLAWGHARVIENLLEVHPECPRALSDQFARPHVIERALLEKGRRITLEQRTKAESDPAVAAASILARESFIDWMDKNGRKYGKAFLRGASAQVKQMATDLVRAHGPDILREIAKTHFKTASEIAPETYPPKADPGNLF
ncbi:MAG TPA: ribonuclease HIII [Chthoniobacteraceae bacterium]|nr:ribonuclease HIII [Chthoniobacteraceae bacterium]